MWGLQQPERDTELSALVSYFLDFVVRLQQQANRSDVLVWTKFTLIQPI